MPENKTEALIVFTDLDATLLDHETYSYAPAEPMIEFLKRSEIPLVFVTSKTKPEVIALQEKIGICAPFIVENGGAVFIPRCCDRLYRSNHSADYDVITLGEEYDACVSMLHALKPNFNVRGFSEMTDEEVADLTGLDDTTAARAKNRYCSEPFILDEPGRYDALQREAGRLGFSVTKGGRFYHLIGTHQSKGNAIRALLERAEAATGLQFRSIALGDSENDFSMLQTVDTPVLIPKPDGSYAPLSLPNLVKAPYPGPRGWNAVLEELLHAS